MESPTQQQSEQPQPPVITLAIRKPAPLFEADGYYQKQFKNIKLSDYAGKYVVLFFYPLDFLFAYKTEIIQFSTKAADFRKNNCEIIGCSVDSKFSHAEYSRKSRADGGIGELDFPLLSDINRKIAEDYGVFLDDTADEGVSLR